MTPEETKKKSKFLSLVLRHDPSRIGIQPDGAGWVSVSELLAALQAHRRGMSRAQLEEVVATNDKQRFAFSPDGLRIRASQGHSIDVDLGYEPMTPPPVLYHGTPERNVASILEKGLLKGERHHVHLSADVATASKVGERRGRPVILEINAGAMAARGVPFFRSANGVWLVDHVPAADISDLRMGT